MRFKIIACVNNKFALGKNNDLLYHIKNDLKNFRRMTQNNIVIMGRNTFESLPSKKPLPNRVNIVMSTTNDLEITEPNMYVVTSLEELENLLYTHDEWGEKDLYVIGGASIYRFFLDNNLVDTIYLTEVIDNTEGDVYFPIFNEDDSWYLFYKSETQFNQPPYTFSIYKKKK